MVATYIGFFHFKLIRNGLKHNKRYDKYCQEYLWKRVFKFNSERVNVQHYITNHEHFVQCHNHLHMSLLIAFAAHLFKRLSSQAKMNRLTWYEYFINHHYAIFYSYILHIYIYLFRFHFIYFLYYIFILLVIFLSSYFAALWSTAERKVVAICFL